MNRLRELREEKKWTQDDLALRLNVKRAAISKYENERIPLTGETLKLLSEIFDVSSDYILGISETRNVEGTSFQKPELITKLEQVKNELVNNKDPLTQERGDQIIQRALKDTGLLAPDGSLSEEGSKVISKFIASNADILKKLIKDEE